MITLRTFIEQEQPRINAALAEAAAELPVSIMPIAQYAMGNGGKRLRPLLTVLVARLLGYADNDIYPLAAAMEMFHVATLLHDDVMDNAEMSRGSLSMKPMAYRSLKPFHTPAMVQPSPTEMAR